MKERKYITTSGLCPMESCSVRLNGVGHSGAATIMVLL